MKRINEHTQRTNDQSYKDGSEYTPEILNKMSLEELEVVRKEMEKRLNQRGSSRPVTHSKMDLDNKKSERDYLNLVRDIISGKMEESVKTFDQFFTVKENTFEVPFETPMHTLLTAGQITDYILKSVGKKDHPLRGIIEIFVQKQLDMR